MGSFDSHEDRVASTRLKTKKKKKMLILHCAAFSSNAPFSVPPVDDMNTSALPGELPSAMCSLTARGVV